jgi:hypothetical protein
MGAARVWVGNERAAAWSGGGGGAAAARMREGEGEGEEGVVGCPKENGKGATARVMGGAARVRGK